MADTASLRSVLLRRLLPAMALVALLGAATAYWVAWRTATSAYDRALYDTALAVAEQLKMQGRTLSQQARAVLLTDKYDTIYFAVHGPRGELLDGDPSLPLPPPDMLAELERDGRIYFDASVGDRAMRVAALDTGRDGLGMTILAAETTVKRNALIWEIIFGMLVPELLLGLASVAAIWFGVRSGLRPLAALRKELADRSPADLSRVQVSVPSEVAPVVAEINALLGRLENALTSQRSFVSDAAHQLRTPIAALQAQVEASLRNASGSTRDEFAGVLAATRRLSHLIDQMLVLARTELLISETSPRLSLPACIQSSAESWMPEAIRRNIDLGFELAGGEIRGNELLLEELVGNLLENALRHTPENGAITVSCGIQDKRVWLAVDDSGSGIPAQERGKIFGRFYQVPGTLGGSGLGLAIVRRIAQQHGGEVETGDSPTLGGARFTVYFPRATGKRKKNGA